MTIRTHELEGSPTRAHAREDERDGHRHLTMASESVPRWRRWLVVVIMATAGLALAGSFFLPWWHFTLYAPQYPHGLHMEISLTGVGGDIGEIDELNHYIGMARLENVAVSEQHFAAYGVAAVSVLVLALTLTLGRKLGKLIVLPALAFPLGFIIDSFYWLYRCGHELDPHAPIHLPAFTPQMFGNGQIGQFLTFARPTSGFWLALLGAAVVVVGTIIRQRSVCAQCTQRGTCGVVCKSAFVLRKEQPAEVGIR